MIQKEHQWDKLLKIKSTGRDDSRSDQNRYPYEPTPYCVLERLANSGYIGKKNMLLDYENLRELLLFFYYPSDEYIGYLMTHEALAFVDEIDCRDLFPGNDPRERILIFEVE